jgi:hypothetical protein
MFVNYYYEGSWVCAASLFALMAVETCSEREKEAYSKR